MSESKSPNTAKKKQVDALPKIMRYIRLFFQVFGRVFPRWSTKIAFKLFTTPRIRAKHRRVDELLSSAQKSDFLFRGIRHQKYQWGEGTRTVLLVHGWESRVTALRYLVPYFLERGFSVIGFDAAAHGSSGGKRTNFVHYAETIGAFINAHPNIEALVTHSFGGSTSIYGITNFVPKHQIKRIAIMAAPAHMEKIIRDYLTFIHAPGIMKKAFVRFIENFVGGPMSSGDISKNILPEVAKLLVIHDKDDRIVPYEEALSIHEAWPQSKLILTEGFGHYNLIKSKEIQVTLAEFITDVSFRPA